MSQKAKEKQIEKEAQHLQQVQRASYVPPQQAPQPFIYPYDSYRLHMDIVIFESQRSIYLALPPLSTYFRVNHVEYEKSRQFTRIYVEDKQYGLFASWKYVVARFRSFGDMKAFVWADAIATFSANYEHWYIPGNAIQKERFSQFNIPNSSKSLSIETALAKIDVSPSVPFVITRFVEQNMIVAYKEMVLSQALLNILGYNNRDTLTSYLFAHGGLPHFYSITEKNRSDWYGTDLRNALSKDGVLVGEEHSTYLITRCKVKKPVIEQHFWICERKTYQSDEALCIYIYKEDPSRPTQIEPGSNEKLAMSSNDSSQRQRTKDVQKFLKKFYNVDPINLKARLKTTCTYRILND